MLDASAKFAVVEQFFVDTFTDDGILLSIDL